jgi:hypothetical protein
MLRQRQEDEILSIFIDTDNNSETYNRVTESDFRHVPIGHVEAR